MAWLTGIGIDSGYASHLMGPVTAVGLGLGLIYGAALRTGTAGVALKDTGIASACVSTGQQLGGAIGTALLNTIAATATGTWFDDHVQGTPTARDIHLASIHGYTTVFWWCTAVFVALSPHRFYLMLRSGPLPAPRHPRPPSPPPSPRPPRPDTPFHGRPAGRRAPGHITGRRLTAPVPALRLSCPPGAAPSHQGPKDRGTHHDDDPARPARRGPIRLRLRLRPRQLLPGPHRRRGRLLRTAAGHRPQDVSLIVWVQAVMWAARFDALAPYHPTAVGVHARIDRRPAAERATNRNKNIAALYASSHVANAVYPEREHVMRQMMTLLGLDPDDTAPDPTTPLSIGTLAGQAAVRAHAHDGMNFLGDLGRTHHGPPFADYTGYRPANTPHELTDPTRWQPAQRPHRRRVRRPPATKASSPSSSSSPRSCA